MIPKPPILARHALKGGLPLTVLDDTLRLAGPRVELDPAEAHVRATGMAMAQDWLLCLPAGEARNEALGLLEAAVERAAQALAA